MVGNGGAARGAACALTDAGAKVALTGRNPDRVRALARLVGGEPMLREQMASRAIRRRDQRHADRHVAQRQRLLFHGHIPAEIVFDMVYNPLETALIRRAREQGKQVIPGMKMFIEQAVRQFEIWTGETAPRATMEKAAALDALRKAKFLEPKTVS